MFSAPDADRGGARATSPALSDSAEAHVADGADRRISTPARTGDDRQGAGFWLTERNSAPGVCFLRILAVYGGALRRSHAAYGRALMPGERRSAPDPVTPKEVARRWPPDRRTSADKRISRTEIDRCRRGSPASPLAFGAGRQADFEVGGACLEPSAADAGAPISQVKPWHGAATVKPDHRLALFTGPRREKQGYAAACDCGGR